MRACELPRSTAYHLINAMIDEGFVVASAPTSTATGSASPPSRSAAATPARSRCSGSPGDCSRIWSTRPSSPPTSPCCTAVTCSTSLEERAPGRPPLVTDVGVRLPAHLTASGRAILAALPPPQVRALYPDRSAFVDRHGARADRPCRQLRTLLAGDPSARLRDRGRRGHAGLRQRRRGGARPQRLPGGGDRDHASVRPRPARPPRRRTPHRASPDPPPLRPLVPPDTRQTSLAGSGRQNLSDR